MKEASDEELLVLFNVPQISEAIVTPSNLSRCIISFAHSVLSDTHPNVWRDFLLAHRDRG